MRKLWCAGAIASGFLLLGAAPALANEPEIPGPASAGSPSAAIPSAGSPFVAGSPSAGAGSAGPSSAAGSPSTGSASAAGSAPGALSGALGPALDPANDWKLGSPLASDPLSGQPLVQLEPGAGQQLARLTRGRAARTEDAKATGNKKSKTSGQPLAPAADVLRTVPGTAPGTGSPLGDGGQFDGLPVQGFPAPLAGQDVGVANLPVDGLVGRALSGVGGLTPAGVASTSGTRTSAPDERPIAGQRLERGQAEFPLLGGLGGALPVKALQSEIADFQSEFSDLPIGGMPVTGRSANTVPDDGTEPTASPAPSASSAVAAADAADTAVAPAASGPASSAASGSGSASAEPSASAGAELPVVSAVPGGFTAGEKPKPAGHPKPVGETIVDDPRLLEEPTEGLVFSGKHKK